MKTLVKLIVLSLVLLLPSQVQAQKQHRSLSMLAVAVHQTETPSVRITGQIATVAIVSNAAWKHQNQQQKQTETEAGDLPQSIQLEQNYPNPFNPTTQIRFTLPEAQAVSLVVYDALGRVVETLARGQFEAGVHDVSFRGNDLASGLYFYVLDAGSIVIRKQMMLLK